MKRIIYVLSVMMLMAVSVQAQTKSKKGKNMGGESVRTASVKMSGMEMSEGLSEDGMKLIKVAYKWYAGIGTADDKQFAIEMAQREAYATISRIIDNAVKDNAESTKLATNGKVQKALLAHWEQVSNSLMKGCEPFGDVLIEFNNRTQMYEATAKVGIRGDLFQKLMKQAEEEVPEGLEGSDLDDFIETNRRILDAAKKP